MMKKMTILAMVAAVAMAATADTATSRENFLKQQAFAEMQRVSGQIDVLQTNHDDLSARVAKLEGGGGELKAVKDDIASLKAEIDQVRREMKRQRQEIVDEITQKVTALMRESNKRTTAAINAATAAAAASSAAPAVNPADCAGYVVVSGDTLSLIAQAFKTTVPKLKALNNLKSDNLRVGQKLIVPKPGK